MTLERRRKPAEQPADDDDPKAIDEHRAASADARRDAAKRAAELVARLRRL